MRQPRAMWFRHAGCTDASGRRETIIGGDDGFDMGHVGPDAAHFLGGANRQRGGGRGSARRGDEIPPFVGMPRVLLHRDVARAECRANRVSQNSGATQSKPRTRRRAVAPTAWPQRLDRVCNGVEEVGEARIALASGSPVLPPRRGEGEQGHEQRQPQRVRERHRRDQHRRQEQCCSSQAEQPD